MHAIYPDAIQHDRRNFFLVGVFNVLGKLYTVQVRRLYGAIGTVHHQTYKIYVPHENLQKFIGRSVWSFRSALDKQIEQSSFSR